MVLLAKDIRHDNVIARVQKEPRDHLTSGDNTVLLGISSLSTVLTAGGVELREQPDRPYSIPLVPNDGKAGRAPNHVTVLEVTVSFIYLVWGRKM